MSRGQSKALHLRVGEAGEKAALALVRQQGWTIVDRNWRCGPLELDLVCREGEIVVFVEVKTRNVQGMARPDQAFTRQKQDRLVRAASAWLSEHQAWSSPCRFDLVTVLQEGTTYKAEIIHHVIELGAGHPVGGGHSPWQPW